RVDCVAKRGRKWRDWRFAGASGGFRAGDVISFDFRGFVNTNGLISIEVALHDAAFIDRNLRLQGVGQRKYDCTTNLLFEDVGIDDLATVDNADHTMRARFVTFHGNLDDLGGIAVKTSEAGDALIVAGGKRFAPSGFVGSHLQNAAHARGLPVIEVLVFFK